MRCTPSSAGTAGLDVLEEPQALLAAMPAMALPDHLAGLHLQGGEQRRRTVTAVVVCPALDLAGSHREQRLRAVQRLDL
jgi:hypothetical protein